jgi:hypothetical protein
VSKINESSYRQLIGLWKTSGEVRLGTTTVPLNGTDSYELILDGSCILHKANVSIGSERSETFEIITTLPEGKIKMQYANSKGESGVMIGNLADKRFTIDGDGIKFDGQIDDGCTVIVGNWYLQSNNNDWDQFIVLKLEKILA